MLIQHTNTGYTDGSTSRNQTSSHHAPCTIPPATTTHPHAHTHPSSPPACLLPATGGGELFLTGALGKNSGVSGVILGGQKHRAIIAFFFGPKTKQNTARKMKTRNPSRRNARSRYRKPVCTAFLLVWKAPWPIPCIFTANLLENPRHCHGAKSSSG